MTLALPIGALAAEMEIMIAPKVTFPVLKAGSSEESVNFFGTNIHLMKSGLLAQRVAAHYGNKPSAMEIHVERVPQTSIFRISAKGSSFQEEQSYLEYLFQEYLAYRAEQFREAYDQIIAQLEDAIKSTKDEQLRKRLEDRLFEARICSLTHEGLVFKRIK